MQGTAGGDITKARSLMIKSCCLVVPKIGYFRKARLGKGSMPHKRQLKLIVQNKKSYPRISKIVLQKSYCYANS